MLPKRKLKSRAKKQKGKVTWDSILDSGMDPELRRLITERREEFVRKERKIAAGDILTATLSQGMLTVVYYEVIKATESMVTLREIKAGRVYEDEEHGQGPYLAYPVHGAYVGPEIRRKVLRDIVTLEPFVRVEDYLYARPWNGNPRPGNDLD